jgi:hypothetical protein
MKAGALRAGTSLLEGTSQAANIYGNYYARRT